MGFNWWFIGKYGIWPTDIGIIVNQKIDKWGIHIFFEGVYVSASIAIYQDYRIGFSCCIYRSLKIKRLETMNCRDGWNVVSVPCLFVCWVFFKGSAIISAGCWRAFAWFEMLLLLDMWSVYDLYIYIHSITCTWTIAIYVYRRIVWHDLVFLSKIL